MHLGNNVEIDIKYLNKPVWIVYIKNRHGDIVVQDIGAIHESTQNDYN